MEPLGSCFRGKDIKERNALMYKTMKIRKLKNYGIPSHILNIWEKHYSPYLLPIQEEAVKKYGILNCGEDKGGRMLYANNKPCI